MKKLWVLCEEPTEYTLDKVRCVFEPMSADVAWRRAASELSPAGAKDALEGMSFIRRLWRVMRAVHTHEALLLNGFAGRVHWMCIVLNALLWHRPLGFAVDTQAGESFQECRGMERGSFRRIIRNAFLGWLFKRPYVYGLPGGSGASPAYSFPVTCRQTGSSGPAPAISALRSAYPSIAERRNGG